MVDETNGPLPETNGPETKATESAGERDERIARGAIAAMRTLEMPAAIGLSIPSADGKRVARSAVFHAALIGMLAAAGFGEVEDEPWKVSLAVIDALRRMAMRHRADHPDLDAFLDSAAAILAKREGSDG